MSVEVEISKPSRELNFCRRERWHEPSEVSLGNEKPITLLVIVHLKMSLLPSAMADLEQQRSVPRASTNTASICQPTAPQDLLPPDVVQAQILPRVIPILQRDPRLAPVVTELAQNGDKVSFVSKDVMRASLGMTTFARYDQRADRVLIDNDNVNHIAKQLIRERARNGTCVDGKVYDDLAEILAPTLAHEMRHRVDHLKLEKILGAGQSGMYVREAEGSGLKDEYIAASRLGERYKKLAADDTFEHYGTLQSLKADSRRPPGELAREEADKLYAFKPKVSAVGTEQTRATDRSFAETYDTLRGRLNGVQLSAYEWMKDPRQIAKIRAYFDDRLK